MSLIIEHATLVDGTGTPRRRASLVIEGERILAVHDESDERNAPDVGRAGRASERVPSENHRLPDGGSWQRIDATGLVAAPGFVDIHSHGDLILAWPDPGRETLLAGRLAQGITTEIVGNCGLGAAPLFGEAAELLRAINGWMAPAAFEWPWESFGDYLDTLEARNLPINVGSLVPHGPLRLGAVGLAEGETSSEARQSMHSALNQALEEGAYGLSAGLIYPPGMYASTDELRDLAATVAAAEGLFSFHIRGSSETLLPAVDEVIQIGEDTGTRVHHSHAEAVGQSHWPKLEEVFSREDAARMRGVRLTADMFPYPVAATMMLAIYPPWSLEGGVPELVERLKRPDERRKIRRDIESMTPEWPPWESGGWPHNLVMAVGWERIIVSTVGSNANQGVVGATLEELGARRGCHPFEAISDLMIEESGNVGQFVLDISGEDGLDALVARDDIAFITDANDYGRGKPHPAAYGSFPRVLARYVRQRGSLSLEQAIRRMTSLPADIIGLEGRGRLEPGAYADVVLFDLESIGDRATLDEPRRQATGVHSVFVNGRCVFSAATGPTGSMPGRVLRKS